MVDSNWVYVNDCPCGKYTRGRYKGKKYNRGDCVIRAFQLAWGLKGENGWREAATRLFNRSLEVGDTQNGDETWQSFVIKAKNPRYAVDENGNEIRNYYGKRRKFTIREFAEYTKHSRKGYIVASQKHLTYVKRGKYYDSWDSGRCKVCSSWVLKES